METDPMLDLDNPDWDKIKSMITDDRCREKEGYKEYICKKCGIKFISPRYGGKYPMCIKHRLKE